MISGEILSFVIWVLSSLDLLLIKRGKLPVLEHPELAAMVPVSPLAIARGYMAFALLYLLPQIIFSSLFLQT